MPYGTAAPHCCSGGLPEAAVQVRDIGHWPSRYSGQSLSAAMCSSSQDSAKNRSWRQKDGNWRHRHSAAGTILCFAGWRLE
jgi:hypothetical protein